MSDETPEFRGATAARRTVLLGAGAVGAAALLAACSDDKSDSGAQRNPDVVTSSTAGAESTTSAAPTSAAGAESLAKAADIPVGGGVILGQQELVVTQPKKGEFKAFGAHCTHMNCLLANVSDGTINCACHGSKFGIADGSVKNGPATRPLTARAVKLSGDSIVLA